MGRKGLYIIITTRTRAQDNSGVLMAISEYYFDGKFVKYCNDLKHNSILEGHVLYRACYNYGRMLQLYGNPKGLKYKSLKEDNKLTKYEMKAYRNMVNDLLNSVTKYHACVMIQSIWRMYMVIKDKK